MGRVRSVCSNAATLGRPSAQSNIPGDVRHLFGARFLTEYIARPARFRGVPTLPTLWVEAMKPLKFVRISIRTVLAVWRGRATLLDWPQSNDLLGRQMASANGIPAVPGTPTSGPVTDTTPA